MLRAVVVVRRLAFVVVSVRGKGALIVFGLWFTIAASARSVWWW